MLAALIVLRRGGFRAIPLPLGVRSLGNVDSDRPVGVRSTRKLLLTQQLGAFPLGTNRPGTGRSKSGGRARRVGNKRPWIVLAASFKESRLTAVPRAYADRES